MTIHLPENLERSLLAEVHSGHFASVDDAMAEAVRLLLGQRNQSEEGRETPGEPPATSSKPLWELAAEIRQSVPEQEWAKLPPDGASQHDHYLYGRSEAADPMRRVFADTHYWIALLNDQDQGHAAAQTATRMLQGATIITTQEVLTEVLNYFSGRGRYLRTAAITFIEGILSNSAVSVGPQSDQTFLQGFTLYKARPDKGYSLTDCISMHSMRQEGVTEVLTDDDHFAQEGFIKLF